MALTKHLRRTLVPKQLLEGHCILVDSDRMKAFSLARGEGVALITDVYRHRAEAFIFTDATLKPLVYSSQNRLCMLALPLSDLALAGFRGLITVDEGGEHPFICPRALQFQLSQGKINCDAICRSLIDLANLASGAKPAPRRKLSKSDVGLAPEIHNDSPVDGFDAMDITKKMFGG